MGDSGVAGRGSRRAGLVWRLSRRRALGLGAVSAASAAFLASCKSKTGAGGSTAPSQGGKPQYGGTFNDIAKSDPPTYDTAQKLTDVAQVTNLTHDALLGFKFGPDVKYNQITVVPKLADRYETPDAQSFTFHLHPGATFANLPPVNGRALTSADVQWTFEYMTRTGALAGKKLAPAPAAVMFEGLDGIETPDASTVVVHFSSPFVPFATYAASQWIPIVAHEIFDQDGNFVKRVVGTGPWQQDAAASQKGTHWVYKKNPTYFAQGRPYIDQINKLILTEDATINAAFLTKQLDILNYSGLTLDTVQQVRKAHPETVEYDYLDAQNQHVYMNVSKPPLNDQRIRQALSLIIDRDEFIKTLVSGRGQWALAGAWPGIFSEAETKQMLKFDPNQAKQLVSAAGFANGVDLELIYPDLNYGQQHVTMIQLLQAQAKKGNINITLKDVDHATESSRKRSGDFQLDVTPRAGLDAGDVDGLLYAIFHPNSKSNYGRVDDPKLTTLLEAQRRETDPAKRMDLIRQAVQYVNEEPWALALFYGQAYQVWWPALHNYAPNMGINGSPVTNSWLVK